MTPTKISSQQSLIGSNKGQKISNKMLTNQLQLIKALQTLKGTCHIYFLKNHTLGARGFIFLSRGVVKTERQKIRTSGHRS